MTANKALFSPVFFIRVDKHKRHIVETVELIAEHFKVQRLYVDKICWLIRTSVGWFEKGGSLDKEQLLNWKRSFLRGPNSFTEKEELANIVENGFLQCKDYDEFSSLRGLMFEGIIIGAFGGIEILKSTNYGWGAEVRIINKGKFEVVDYQCKLQRKGDCDHRLTIDFGYWNKDEDSGEFFECKVTPNYFQCKEDMYMKTLQDKISEIGGKGKYYLAAPLSERGFQFTSLYSKDVTTFGIDSINRRYLAG